MRHTWGIGVLALAGACGGGGGGSLRATIETDGGTVEFEQACAISDRTDDYGFHSIGGDFGFEAIWDLDAVPAPNSYTLEPLGNIVFFVEFPDPEDPGSPTFDDAEGAIDFVTHDAEGGLFAGTFDVYVPADDPADPPLVATIGVFECGE